MRYLVFLGAFVVMLATSGTAHAQSSPADCLRLERRGGWWGFANSCNRGVDFKFSDQGSCSNYRCAGYVGRGSFFQTGNLSGTVNWVACFSNGIGATIVTRTASGGWECR